MVVRRGTNGRDALVGTTATDSLYGFDGSDYLEGQAGADFLDGGSGADVLVGGTGRDTYVVDDAGDVVIESGTGSGDLIIASVSYVLPALVENLILVGGGDLAGIGNELSNSITGNAGNNVLLGGAGNDTLRGGDGVDILRGDAGTDHLFGGSGTDVFLLTAAQDSRPGSQRDIIYDFNAGQDLLHLIDIAPGVPITYLGSASLKAGAGSVQTRLAAQGSDGLFQIDLPGSNGLTDGVADAEILLKGVQSLNLWNVMSAVGAPVAAAPPPAPTPVPAPAPAPIAPAGPPSGVGAVPGGGTGGDAQRVVYIDPSAGSSGDGSFGSPFSGWGGWTMQAGTSYLVKAGTVMNGFIVLKGQGTEAAPITFSSYGNGAPPVINGSVIVENGAHITVSNLAIQNSSLAGVTVHSGARDITVLNNTIKNTPIGVWFGSDSGDGNLVQGNLIENSQQHGVSFDRLDHSADPSLVIGNVIRGAGSHGVQIHANGVRIENNEVASNGSTFTGSSGIHIYGGLGRPDGWGFDNVIIGNRVYDTREAGNGYDGNGIQADQYTGRNLIANNTVYGNDGAGILLYDSASNTVTGNTVTGNLLDRSGRHPYRAEIILASDIDTFNDMTRGNSIKDNRVITTDPTVGAFFVDPPTADNGNVFGGNTVERPAGGAVYFMGGIFGTQGSDMALWNSTLARGGGDDFWT